LDFAKATKKDIQQDLAKVEKWQNEDLAAIKKSIRGRL
jgi:hypothetical protein